MGNIRLYVSERDRRVLDALPPDVSRSEILRIGLRTYLGNAAACPHTSVRCTACGEPLSREVADPTG